MTAKPDLRQVTAVLYGHQNPRAAVKLLAAHADALDLGDIKYLNHFEGYAQFTYWENYETWKFVRTAFALILHLDGYVINPGLWDQQFLAYDYIGAPWPSDWKLYQTGEHRVGNGGFCLKSRALMNRVAALPWVPDIPGDILVCCHYRKLLEAEGFKFAPPEVAARFSVEHVVAETPAKTFGFHGRLFPGRFPAWHAERSAI